MESLMEASEWRSEWGDDRLILLQGDGHVLPVESRQFLKEFGLPRVVIFECPTPFEIHFTAVSKDLVPYNSLVRWGGFYDEERHRAWGEQIVIGEEDFCNGSACYGVQRARGVVTRLDCELPQPECFANSSVALFGQVLLAATRWSSEIRNTGAVPSADSLRLLAEQISAFDPASFESREHFWPSLLRFISEEGPESFEIISDPARSKPRF
jgi:hypothetical protein